MIVHLVSPVFRRYWRSYVTALRALGHEVSVSLYDRLPSARRKLTNKLVVEIPSRLGTDRGDGALARRHTQAAIQDLPDRVDAVLIIKGDTLLESFWDRLERFDAPVVVYLYDDLERTRFELCALRRATHVATYCAPDVDRLRAHGISASYLPLFFDDTLAFVPRSEDVVAFVGARYAARERLLLELDALGIPVVAYGRDWSARWVDRARSLEFHRPLLAGRPDVSLGESYGIAAGATVAVNIHGLAGGLNSRTFEIPGAGGLQLVDRPDVSELYEPGKEVLIYSSGEQLKEYATRAFDDPAWAASIRAAGRRRTLAEHTALHRMRTLGELW